jgi:carboxypeptidase Taq
MNYTETLEKLRVIDREYRHLERAIAALQWDQETNLPPDGVEERSEQLALLEGIAHGRLIEPETGRLLAQAGSSAANPRGDESLPALERDFLRVMYRRLDRAIKLPPDFVSASARAEGLSQAAWVLARRNNDFAAFLPHLETMIGNARKKAKYWGYGEDRPLQKPQPLYDGLLDIFEPGMGQAEIGALFATLRDRLSALLRKIKNYAPPDTSFLKQTFPIEQQAIFNQKLMDYLGFDRRRGRLDTSAHPFTATLGSNDIRITTRYFPDNLLSGLFSVIHESGHALYEMGFPPELRGTCLADGASMALHESQSRFWENVIGRSRHFWNGLFPLLRETFPEQLTGVSTEQFYRAANEVKPSLIRVDADEVSYSLHIILRFELEQQLISGVLEPKELPAIWREKTREYLGLEIDPLSPRSDADGVMQDIHWSMGSFGYFPSYVLGNLYSLQFTRKLRQDIPELDNLVAAGKFGPCLEWLRNTIYCWGCRLEPAELLHKITGEKLRVEPFLEYIEHKYGELYC